MKSVYQGIGKVKSLVIFKVGDTFKSLSEEIGDYDQWIMNGLGSLPCPVTVIDPRKEDNLPDIAWVAGSIITGSHNMVTDRAPWSENLAAWLRTAVSERVPVLGICYGHQLLAHALGGTVDYHPGGMELGTVPVRLSDAAENDLLFKGMPPEFAAQAVHSQSVRTLPKGAILLAGNAFEPHHAFCLANSAWGVQFHPEFSPMAMSSYIRKLTKHDTDGGAKAEALLNGVLPTRDASSILSRFAKVVQHRMTSPVANTM
jgi:GMP synthase (glutamine-hydrolysing)